MKRLSTLFVMLFLSYFTHAKIWMLLDMQKNEIPFSTIFHEHDEYEFYINHEQGHDLVYLVSHEENIVALSIKIFYDENDICNKITLTYSCKDCFFNHWKNQFHERKSILDLDKSSSLPDIVFSTKKIENKETLKYLVEIQKIGFEIHEHEHNISFYSLK